MMQEKQNSINFFQRVYLIARQVPDGRITTYGSIARAIGLAGSARMVGWAMNKAYEQEEYVPAHRVVNRKGLLTGKIHFPGENTMQELLENEGITVIDNQIQDFEKYFWEPPFMEE